ncbi:TetR family transcriptional regulator [Roseomonas haemaphysalidis]|uniref:TetR family transcriptional regulator n=1 Tax=Roseomonas haemaphysalidis TaxID=2768162 RepID=A0ABS3KNR4_9PROT|nr:TetR family transcriptional regulator [Roseomonas haemaphysalidis]MBO1079108.1 TetR family transcriptional regulator [Roseomonas haemaphysalidis]
MARRTKQEADETREALLNAAELVFLERGVARASLDEIARAAGCSRGAVHWHFGDKLGLFLALDERLLLFQDEACELLADKDDCRLLSSMRGNIVDAMLRLEQDPHRRRLLTVMLQRCEYVDEMAPALERRLKADATMRSVLRRRFEAAVAHGEMACAWSPEQAATFLHSLIGGLINDWLRADGAFSLSHDIDQALEVFFACLGVATPQAVSTHA